MESSIACRDSWLSKAQLIQRCKSGHASSLAVWIESKSPSLGGRKIRRGVTIGIKWRIKRLRWNCSGLAKTKRPGAPEPALGAVEESLPGLLEPACHKIGIL